MRYCHRNVNGITAHFAFFSFFFILFFLQYFDLFNCIPEWHLEENKNISSFDLNTHAHTWKAIIEAYFVLYNIFL